LSTSKSLEEHIGSYFVKKYFWKCKMLVLWNKLVGSGFALSSKGGEKLLVQACEVLSCSKGVAKEVACIQC